MAANSTISIKRKLARAIHPNRGAEARYRRALITEIAQMVSSIEFWVTARRNSSPPILAEDASPSVTMRDELAKLFGRWSNRFGERAPELARKFVLSQFSATDSSMRQALLDAGWSVEFTMTPAVRDAFEASIAENVALIKSIPAQYLQQVEGVVMRSYAAGGDLQAMVRDIRALAPVTKRRAILIARDQGSKANAVVTRARQKELGVTQAIWMHSHAGKEPRPTHVAMNGKRYDVSTGMYDSAIRKWIYPGEEINCRCTSRSVLPWTPAEK